VLVDVAALQRENSALREQLDKVLSTNSQLVDEVAKLNDRVAELLAIAQRKQLHHARLVCRRALARALVARAALAPLGTTTPRTRAPP